MSNNNRIQEIRNRRAIITPDWEFNGNEIISSQNPRRGIGGFLTEEDNEFAENAPYDIDFLLSEYDRLQEILIGQNKVIEAYGRIVRDMESDYVEILERISQSSMSQYASVEDMVKGMKLIASTALSHLKG